MDTFLYRKLMNAQMLFAESREAAQIAPSQLPVRCLSVSFHRSSFPLVTTSVPEIRVVPIEAARWKHQKQNVEAPPTMENLID